MWPVRNWTTQKDVSSEPASEALSAAAHCYLLFPLPPEPVLILQPAPPLPWLTLLAKPCSLRYPPRSMENLLSTKLVPPARRLEMTDLECFLRASNKLKILKALSQRLILPHYYFLI